MYKKLLLQYIAGIDTIPNTLFFVIEVRFHDNNFSDLIRENYFK